MGQSNCPLNRVNPPFGRDEPEDVERTRPEPAQADPEPAIRGGDTGTPVSRGDRGELLPQRDVLKREVGVRAKSRPDALKEDESKTHHDAPERLPRILNGQRLPGERILARDRSRSR